jgi:hypothetical protein
MPARIVPVFVDLVIMALLGRVHVGTPVVVLR